MGSSTELQDLVMGEGSKMLIDAASEVSFNQSDASIALRQPIRGQHYFKSANESCVFQVRASARHYWAELVQHAKTEPMLKQALTEVEMRNIKKTLQSLK